MSWVIALKSSGPHVGLPRSEASDHASIRDATLLRRYNGARMKKMNVFFSRAISICSYLNPRSGHSTAIGGRVRRRGKLRWHNLTP